MNNSKAGNGGTDRSKTGDKGAVKLGPRAIPIPRSISEEAQAALARLVGEDGIPLHAHYEMPQPDDFAGWMRMKAAADAQYACAPPQRSWNRAVPRSTSRCRRLRPKTAGL
jgi:hypothetical protein